MLRPLRTAGKVAAVNVERGSRVRTGATLIAIDQRQARLMADEAQTQIASALTQSALTQAECEHGQRLFGRKSAERNSLELVPQSQRVHDNSADSAQESVTNMGLLNRLGAALSSDADPAALRQEISRLDAELAAQSQAHQTLQAVVDTAPVAIVVLDEVGMIRFTNAAARELFFEGNAPEGQNFLLLLSAVPEPLRRALLSETDHIFSFGSHGESETYQLAKRHLILGGQPHSMLTVRNMTMELSRQENAVLRKAIRVIHHEFANSLAPVLSLLRSARGKLSKPDAAPKLEQMLTVIEDRVSHLNVFLSGFAALGRLPAPRLQEVEWEGFLGRLRPLLEDIAIEAAPPGRGWFDPTQVEQILINLVKNAREAGSPAQDIVLEIAAAAEGGYRATVSDRGQGMNDEALEHAMVPSFTTKSHGSGMGLTLCREIVDAHRGRLRIARREGGGISVSFWLPPREVAGSAGSLSRARLSLSRC